MVFVMANNWEDRANQNEYDLILDVNACPSTRA